MLDIFYPKHCPICLDVLPPGKSLICAPCVKKIRYVRGPVCFKCGQPIRDETAEYCYNCRRKPPAFDEGIAWGQYGSQALRRMMSQVKYHQNPQLLDYPCLSMAKRFEEKVRSWEAEALIPVPVHEKRLLERGYNQAEEIANRLAEVWKIPVDAHYLVRRENTAAQKTLQNTERLLNLNDAFAVNGPVRKYRSVILIDDIYTTGSTAGACAKQLKAAGIQKVYSAVLLTGRS